MKDITISKKVGDKHIQMITVKEGWKVGLSPAFKKELIAWFKDPSDAWLNYTFKEWDNKTAAPSAHATAKQDGYQPATSVDSDEIPFS